MVPVVVPKGREHDVRVGTTVDVKTSTPPIRRSWWSTWGSPEMTRGDRRSFGLDGAP